jgi:CBS domain-containing protein
MHSKHVNELMESDMAQISPDATLEQAARKMKEVDCGFLPVGEGDMPEGIITDRDIVIRAVAEGRNPSETKVRDCMTANICCCGKEDTLEDAAGKMSENKVSRLLVKDGDGMVCGILTFGRLIRGNRDAEETSAVVEKATGKAA